MPTHFILLLVLFPFLSEAQSKAHWPPVYFVNASVMPSSTEAHFSNTYERGIREQTYTGSTGDFQFSGGGLWGVGSGLKIGGSLSYAYSQLYFDDSEIAASPLIGFVKEPFYFFQHSTRHQVALEILGNWVSGQHQKVKPKVGFYGELALGIGYNYVATKYKVPEGGAWNWTWRQETQTDENESPINLQARIEIGGYLFLSKGPRPKVLKVGFPIYVRQYIGTSYETDAFLQIGFVKVGFEF